MICPSGQSAAAQMPGFDLPWLANQIDPVRQICDWKNYFQKSMLRKITPRARRMGGAQRYPSRRRVTMLACRMPGAALDRVRDTRANKKRDRKAPFKAASGLLDAYLILDSLNSTCLRATGSYFFLTSLSVMVREFFLAT